MFQWEVHPQVCSLFTMGSELRAAGESPYPLQATRSPRMLSSPTAPFVPWTVCTPWRCPSSHFPPRTSMAQLVLSGPALVPPRLFWPPDWTPLRTVVMPHLPPDTGSIPAHLGPSLKAMSRSRWDSLPRTTSAESQGRNDLVTEQSHSRPCVRNHAPRTKWDELARGTEPCLSQGFFLPWEGVVVVVRVLVPLFRSSVVFATQREPCSAEFQPQLKGT